ncbi:outer membrane beta-barrel family protein [Sediminibacterium ginsengisoli]|uniref:Outer membrane receptor proteins, mostly Fe transport n=1 Tax=Sediminibacterium ginsengisoli TaxID=413434 RepID=A0A1T4K8J1_9BACT|nr:outer membrane beta-barrel family protein [Sediminibacterium ginsengisoli]SJZ38754.1 Outer membrane receptor proteins, mostly Fe transport [Sediminibacterium ginsengisoli]
MQQPFRYLYIGLILFCFPAYTIAQQQLKGTVTDNKGNPLANASLVLLRDSSFAAASIADSAGHFILSASPEQGKSYDLKCTLAGYLPFTKHFVYPDTTGISKIVLVQDAHMLANVTVTATKPLVTRKADRYIVNVENSFLASAGSGLDVLERSPGVWVSQDGSIRINGNQSVTVMINDVMQRMDSDALAEYLRTLKSEDISRIEIIQNPPAEFEASGSGGIIHIILKKGRRDGLTGSIFSQYRQQGKEPYINGGISFDYKRNAFYLSGNTSAMLDKNSASGTNDILYANKNTYHGSGFRHNRNTRQLYRLNAAYDISDNQSVTLQSQLTNSRLSNVFTTYIEEHTGGTIVTGVNYSDWFRKPGNNGVNITYKLKLDSLGSGLKIIGDYTKGTKEEINAFEGLYSDVQQNARYTNSTPNITTIYTLQSDFTKVLPAKTEFKAGAKYAAIKRDNETIVDDYINNIPVRNQSASNHFIYDETLLMAYASLSKTWNKTSVHAGLRAEQTYAHGHSVTDGQQFSRSYFGWFPSLFATQTLNEEGGSMIYFSYARRLQRPGFNQLNPYRLQINKVTVITGNPDLLPQYTHNIQAGYQFLHGLSADIYFSVTDHIIAQLTNPLGNNIIETQYRNFNSSTEAGLLLNANTKIFSWWNSISNLSLYRTSNKYQDFSIKQTSYSLRSTQNFILKKIAELNIGLEYRSAYVTANSKASDFIYTDFSMSRRILNNKGRISFYISDLLNTAREQEKTDYNGTHVEFYQKRQTRNFALAFNYNFSLGKTFARKKIEQENSDEKKRIDN